MLIFNPLSIFKSRSQKAFRLQTSKHAEPIRGNRKGSQRLHFDVLEDRTAPATFADAAPTLNLILDANEHVGIVSSGNQYSLVLTGGNWAGTDTGSATGNGTNTLTVTAAGLAAFTDINLSDSGANASVAFDDSGANFYSENFNITLDNGSVIANGLTFNGATRFSSTASLSATTDSAILVNPAATLQAVDGNLFLSANSGIFRAGNFIGITVSGDVSTSGAGNITLVGQGGVDPANPLNIGVYVNGAAIAANGTGSVTLFGIGGSGTTSNYGVDLNGGSVTSVSGAIQLTGTAGAGTGNFNIGVLVSNATVQSTTSGPIFVTGTGGAGTDFDDGVRITGAAATIAAFDGDISLTGTAGANGLGIQIDGLASVAANGLGRIFLTSDSMQLTTAVINGGGNDVVIDAASAATVIDLGGADAAGRLGLSDTELDNITSGRLFIGNPTNIGGIEVTAAIGPANSNELLLNTSAAIVDLNAAGVDITASLLALTAETGIGTIANPLEIEATILQAVNGTNGGLGDVAIVQVVGALTIDNATNVGGDIVVETTAGDLNINFVNGVAAGVRLLSSNAIVGNPFHQILGGRLQLTAGTGIGTAVAPIATIVNDLAASTASGGIFVANNGALAVSDVAVAGITLIGISGGGAATISAASPLTINSPINMTGDVLLSAGEVGDAPAWADDLTINAAVASTAGIVTLRAGDDVIFNGIVPTAFGAVTAEAGFGDLDGRGAIIVNGTNADDTLVLSVNALLNQQFVLNGSAPVVLLNLDQFGFSGLDGDDRVVVDFVNGNPVPNSGVGFDGGNQVSAPGDILTLIGSGVEVAFYTPDAVSVGRGFIDVDGQGIAFRNLEPVQISAFAQVTLDLPNAQDIVTMQETVADFDNDANTADADGLLFQGTSGGIGFESLSVRNVGTVVVDTSFSDDPFLADSITLLSGANAHLNGNLGIFTGNNGEDDVIVNGAVTFDVGPTAASTIQIISNGTIALNAPLRAGNRYNGQGAVIARGYVDLTARTNQFGVIGITGSGVGADIYADDISLWANNDIGDFANSIPVRTEAFDLTNSTIMNLEARSNFGGLLLVNAGDITVGGVDFGFNLDLQGITAFGGEVNFFNFGTMNVNLNGETVFAVGDITMVAQDLPTFNLDGDILVGSQTGDRTLANVRRAIQTSGINATINLRADRDIQLGDGLGWGDVVNLDGVLIQIIADVDLDGNGDVFATNSTLVQVRESLFIRGQNIVINNTASTFTAFQTFGGTIQLATNPDGVITIFVGGVADAGLNVSDTVDSNPNGAPGGIIQVIADDVDLTPGGAGLLAFNAHDSSIEFYLATSTYEIELGDTVDLGRLNLNNGELQLLEAGIVRIGGDQPDVVNNVPTNTGDILITEVIVQPTTWSRLALRTAGAINEDAAAGLTASYLLLVGLNGVNLCDGANVIVEIAGVTDPGNSFKVANLLTGNFVVGSVDGTGGINTTGGDVTLFAPNSFMVLVQPILAGDQGVVRLTAGQGFTQNAFGFIVAARLGVRNEGPNATGDIYLPAGNNQLNIFAAMNEAPGGTVVLLSKTFGPDDVLSLDIVTDDAACFTLTAGVITSNGDFTILVFNGNLTTGKLTIDEFVDVGTATVRLYAIAGIVDTGGGFTAALLSALNAGNAGNIELGGANQVGTFAAFNQFLGGKVSFVNDGTLILGVVPANAILPELSGLQSQNADAIVQATNGSLSLLGSAVVGDASLALLAYNGITQGPDGRIIARALAVENSAQQNILLDNAGNLVNVFAASTLVAGDINNGLGRIVLKNGTGFQVGQVNIAAIGNVSIAAYELAAGFTPNNDSVTGITTAGGTVDLNSAGAVELLQSIDAGTGAVLLTTTGGLTQTVAGVIFAGVLGVDNSVFGDIALNQQNQVDGVVGFKNAVLSGAVYFINDFGVSIGGVAASTLFNGVDGIATANGVAVVDIEGSLAIETPVNVGTSRVLLQATEGITQQAAGIISAAGLSAANVDGVNAATGDIRLDAANAVATFAGLNQAASGLVVFNDVETLAIGVVDSVAGVLGGAAGVQSSEGNIVLVTAGTLNLNAAVSTTQSTADVLLRAATGVNQTASGPIRAENLAVQNTIGGQVLLTAANDVLGFAAKNSAAFGTIAFVNFNDLSIRAIAGFAPLTNDVNGVTSDTGSVALTISGRLRLDASVSAATETVRLHAQAGIEQSATSVITANALGAENAGGAPTSGPIDLSAVNAVNVVALNNAAAGEGVTFRNANSTTVGSVPLVAGLFNGATGAAANNGDVTVLSNQGLTLSQPIFAGTGTARLFATQGIQQAANGKVSAANLAAENKAGGAAATGNIDLTATNSVLQFTAYNGAINGFVTFVNNGALTVDTTPALTGVFEQTTGIFANNSADGAITLTVPGVTTLKQFLLTKTVLHGQGAGGLSLQKSGTIDRVEHTLATATSGSVQWTASSFPTMTLTYDGMANAGPINDQQQVTNRSFNVTALNKITDVAAVNGSTTTTKINTTDNSTMRVDFLNPVNGGSLEIKIASEYGPNGDTVDAANLIGSANASIEFRNLAGNVNIANGHNAPAVAVRLVGGNGIDRFAFFGDSAISWTPTSQAAIDGGNSNNDLLDYFFSTPGAALGNEVAIDLALRRAKNINNNANNAIINVENVLIGNTPTVINVTASLVAPGIYVFGDPNTILNPATTGTITLNNNVPISDVIRFFGANSPIKVLFDNTSANVKVQDDVGQAGSNGRGFVTN